jgi:hypothetical protein
VERDRLPIELRFDRASPRLDLDRRTLGIRQLNEIDGQHQALARPHRGRQGESRSPGQPRFELVARRLDGSVSTEADRDRRIAPAFGRERPRALLADAPDGSVDGRQSRLVVARGDGFGERVPPVGARARSDARRIRHGHLEHRREGLHRGATQRHTAEPR